MAKAKGFTALHVKCEKYDVLISGGCIDQKYTQISKTTAAKLEFRLTFYLHCANIVLQGVIYMEMSSITFRIEKQMKQQLESVCKKIGLTPSSALNVFAAAMIKEQGIPFPVTAKESVNRMSKEELVKNAKELIGAHRGDYERLAE